MLLFRVEKGLPPPPGIGESSGGSEDHNANERPASATAGPGDGTAAGAAALGDAAAGGASAVLTEDEGGAGAAASSSPVADTSDASAGAGSGGRNGSAVSTVPHPAAASEQLLTWEKLSPAEFQQLQDFAACKTVVRIWVVVCPRHARSVIYCAAGRFLSARSQREF